MRVSVSPDHYKGCDRPWNAHKEAWNGAADMIREAVNEHCSCRQENVQTAYSALQARLLAVAAKLEEGK